jgi:hypothetical protein
MLGPKLDSGNLSGLRDKAPLVGEKGPTGNGESRGVRAHPVRQFKSEPHYFGP